MNTRSSSRALLMMAPLLVVLSLSSVVAQENLTLSGRVVTKAAANATPRFSVKLYPPIKSNKPILLSTTGAAGEFKFVGLAASSYLLEVYLGKELVHQQVVYVDDKNSRELTIDLSGRSTKTASSAVGLRNDKAGGVDVDSTSLVVAGFRPATGDHF